MVAACAPESSQWSPTQSVKKNEVRWVTFEHDVLFGVERPDTISEEEKRRLGRFLALHDAGYGDQIMVGALGSVPDEGSRENAGQREQAVIRALRGTNLRVRRMPDVPAQERWDGSVKIVLGRFVVVPPDCPDWSKRADGDPNNRVSSNFGCATATNLGLMVADPGDLVRGRRPGPADGAVGARRYKAYREGEQTQAPALTPLVIQSGVGGGGGE